MSKALFILVILIGLLGIGFVGLAQLGALPPSVLAYVINVQQHIPYFQQQVAPELRPFEGVWNVTLDISDTKSDRLWCDTITGAVVAHNGAFSGSVGPFAARLPLQATTTTDGYLEGVFGDARSSQRGTFTASLTGDSGRGTWKSDGDCAGTIILTHLAGTL